MRGTRQIDEEAAALSRQNHLSEPGRESPQNLPTLAIREHQSLVSLVSSCSDGTKVGM